MCNPTPNVNSQYGAPMGRRQTGYGADPTTKFNLVHIRLNNGGYDRGGAYWGIDKPLYYYHAYETHPNEKEVDISDFIRAYDREDAKTIIRHNYPNARFFR
jgi:hypothetical protein